MTSDQLREEFERRGPWFTRYVVNGQTYGGQYDGANDARLAQLFARVALPGRVLELGAFEGAHALRVASHSGTLEVVGVEGRDELVERARFAQRVLGVPNVSFLGRNLETFDLASLGAFDLVVCIGLLYHLPEPMTLLEQIGKVAPRLFLWTHYCHEDEVTIEHRGYPGKWYREFGRNDVLSGLSDYSFWPTKPALLRMLGDVGLGTIEVIDDVVHQNGPCVTLFASNQDLRDGVALRSGNTRRQSDQMAAARRKAKGDPAC